MSTLSERFDSGRIRVDFAVKDNQEKEPSNTTGVLQYFKLNNSSTPNKKLQVIFRDEEVYNNTSVGFLAKAFEKTTDIASRDYMAGIIGNYKNYLLESQLRGSADIDPTVNDSIGKIGNFVCPAPAVTTATPAATN